MWNQPEFSYNQVAVSLGYEIQKYLFIKSMKKKKK